MTALDVPAEQIEAFIKRWSEGRGGAERANFQPFIYELTDLLGLDRPDPAEGGVLGAYQFEGPVPGGSARAAFNKGFIDLYKRGCFVMEAKQSQLGPGQKEQAGLFDEASVIPLTPAGARYDRLMVRAQGQAKNYAVNLPGSEPTVPFLIVCDIGRAFELYFDFAGNGRGYGFFPDRKRYRLPLVALRDLETRALLKDIWTNPSARDPRLRAAEVTRDVSRRLAEVSKALEMSNRFRARDLAAVGLESAEIEETALFLMRLLFCMFAEDIGLLPKDAFKSFLAEGVENEDWFEQGLKGLWGAMNAPEPGNRFAAALKARVDYFNGGLFESNRVFTLTKHDRGELLAAARTDWRKVEPAIFGTLLEQALTAAERARLGAHYTPRAYVERLVDATIIEVLSGEWEEAQERMTDPEATADEALAIVTAFHDRIADVTVLDPACGTGNFLYVAMEAIERLEAGVIETIDSLGGSAEPRVGPHQFFGLELNPRAAKIAELVLWIGWLRFRIENNPESVPEPILSRGANINFGRHGGYDAVLERKNTGEPDLEHPVRPAWPETEFIVGNPPFIGKGSEMRERLGDAYVEALWKANPRVPKSADFVMQWWDRAAEILTAEGTKLRRFGLVTTNSITQEFSRRVIARHLPRSRDGAVVRTGNSNADTRAPGAVLSLIFAIPDHPWVKAPKENHTGTHSGGRKDRLQLFDPEVGFFEEELEESRKRTGPAAVRIAMTVAERGLRDGLLMEVVHESGLDSDEPTIELAPTQGRINASLTVGSDVSSARPLLANTGLSCNGMMLAGQGFKIDRKEANVLIGHDGEAARRVIRPHIGGSELLQRRQDSFVIDFFGLSEIEARREYPAAYQHVLRTVKPERDTNRRPAFQKRWWIFGEPRSTFRPALADLDRYIATTRTSKHRVFQFVQGGLLPNHEIVAIASANPFHLGVLSARIHVVWALRAGGTLEDRPRYNKGRVFDPFPFPDATQDQRDHIAELAEELDTIRKAALKDTPGLTMTEIYNLRAKVAARQAMSVAEQNRAMCARAGIVDRLHQQIDEAVAAAYGWPAELAPAETVARLVALNAERAGEEAAGRIRWLRPDYQVPRFDPKETNT